MSISHGAGSHQLELLIENHVLPFNMTVYQAIKQFSLPYCREKDANGERTTYDERSVWHNIHTIQYVNSLRRAFEKPCRVPSYLV